MFLSLDIPLSSVRIHSTLPFLPFEYVNRTHKHHSHLRLRKPPFITLCHPRNRPSLKLYRRVSHPKEFHPLAKRRACVETAHIHRTFNCASNELKKSSLGKFPFLFFLVRLIESTSSRNKLLFTPILPGSVDSATRSTKYWHAFRCLPRMVAVALKPSIVQAA